MNLLIDSLSLQARVHLQDGRRLSFLLAGLGECSGVRAAFSPPAALCDEQLEACDAVMITTRKHVEADYTEAELDAIERFVRRGGGLLLMSNHGDIPGRPYPDLTASDARLAARFGIAIENSFFADAEWGRPVACCADARNPRHPVMTGHSPDHPVQTMVISNCASILPGAADALVTLPPSLVDYRDARSPASRCLAVALDRDACGGRIVVTADSGFIGSPGTVFPGAGLLGQGGNLRFVVNTLLWLGGV